MINMDNRIATSIHIYLWLRQLNFTDITIFFSRPAFRMAVLELSNHLLEIVGGTIFHQQDRQHVFVLFGFQDPKGLMRAENRFEWPIKDYEPVKLAFHQIEESPVPGKLKSFLDHKVNNPRAGNALSDVQKHSGERLKCALVSLLCKVVCEEKGAPID